MSKFKSAEFYDRPLAKGYRLLPLRFTKLQDDRYVLSNFVGEFHVLDRPTLESFARHELSWRTQAYLDLKSKHFLYDEDSSVAIDLLGLKARTKLQSVSGSSVLQIFVVTLRCEHSCPYCQVSRQSDDKHAFDMSRETADKAVDLVFQSPAKFIKIEFQGGEPLLNFEGIKHIVLEAEKRNAVAGRVLQFVIATNLALIDDEILAFCKAHNIFLSTSLDGPQDLHNKNRPRPGSNSHQKVTEGVERARAALGFDGVSALMTTTLSSLPRVKEIVDEYVRFGFNGIFLRPLSPYGFAVKTKLIKGYNRDAWLKFYFEGLDYIVGLDASGKEFTEYYAATILTKMLTPHNPGYVDLMNPAGMGVGVLVYNYDGDVYASDEGRMLAEMGDKKFRIGNVHSDTFESLLLSDTVLDALESSFTGSAPMCSDCAFEPYCGAEPVYHYATQGDYVGRKPESDFCARNMAIFRYLINKLETDEVARNVFRRWANHN